MAAGLKNNFLLAGSKKSGAENHIHQ